MFGLSHFFYPWGFLLQGLAIVHFIRRRPENYWFYVIFFLGPPGAAIYILAEVLPDLGLLRGFFQGFGRRSRVQVVVAMVPWIRTSTSSFCKKTRFDSLPSVFIKGTCAWRVQNIPDNRRMVAVFIRLIFDGI